MTSQENSDINGSFELFEENVNYFDLNQFSYIRELIKEEQEYSQNQEFIIILEMKIKVILTFIIENLNKEEIKKCILNMTNISSSQQLNSQYTQIISNLKTQYKRLNQTQLKNELLILLLWFLFDIDNS